MFNDRDHAAGLLADAVEAAHPKDPVVLALPRGGLPVAAPVAKRLGAPLDLLMVRKLGMPGQPELAGGAVVDGPAHEVVFNKGILAASGLTEADFKPAIEEQLAEIERRRHLYLGDHAPVDVTGRTAIVVDDGIATGATVKAAIKALRKRGPAEIWLAVPVAPADAVPEFEALVDRMICLETPSPFWAVGAHYARFEQVSDEVVAATMRAAWSKETGNDKTE